MFVVPHKREVLFDLPNLIVTVPEPDYLLAMKILALRPETEDENDAKFLIKHLNLKSQAEVLEIVAEYYPHKQVKPQTEAWLDGFFFNK